VADGRDAGAFVHVETDIALLGQPRLTRVQAHAHSDGSVVEGALAILGRSDRVGCAAEGDEERVTLSVDLDAVVRGEGGTEAPPMLAQGISVTVA
jgi:hypothetical protein